MNGDSSKRGIAATWFAIGLALAIPAAVLLSFMRGLTSVWRTKWESPGTDTTPRYEIGAQSRVSMPGAPSATAAPPAAKEEPEAPPEPRAEEQVASEDTAVGLEITSATSPIERGGVATVEVKARPRTKCTIEYRLPGSGNVSNAHGLEPKTADKDGLASWSWTIGPSTTPGSGSVSVTSGGETVEATIEVT